MTAAVIRDLTALRAATTGPVFVPGDDGYEQARRIWNGDIDRRPAVVARCSGPGDIAVALAYARDQGLEVAVRGGGHGYWGAAVPERGLMIDLSALDTVTVDPAARRARCGGGASLAQLDAATQAARPRRPGRHGQPHRRRRPDAWRRFRLAHPAARPEHRQPGVLPRWCWPMGAACEPARPSTPTCSGRCAEAAATSGWSPSSSSGCTRSGRWCTSAVLFVEQDRAAHAIRTARDCFRALPPGDQPGHRLYQRPARPIRPRAAPLRARRGGNHDRVRVGGGARRRGRPGSRGAGPAVRCRDADPLRRAAADAGRGRVLGRPGLHQGPVPRRAARRRRRRPRRAAARPKIAAVRAADLPVRWGLRRGRRGRHGLRWPP